MTRLQDRRDHGALERGQLQVTHAVTLHRGRVAKCPPLSPELGRSLLLLGIALPGAGDGVIAPDSSTVFGRYNATIAAHEVGPKLPVRFVELNVESTGGEPRAYGVLYHGRQDR
jgi:hypothetical protein